MIEHAVQFGIAALGAGGLVLVTAGRARTRRAGFTCGLAAQPLWVWTTVTNRQWGMVALTAMYTVAWLWGWMRTNREIGMETSKSRSAESSKRPAMKCRSCGCTDLDCSGCIARTGVPCYWIESDLCSACIPPTTGS